MSKKFSLVRYYKIWFPIVGIFLFLLITIFLTRIQTNNLVTGDVVEELKSLPYLSWVPIDEKDKLKSGVTKYDEDLSFKGINIYSSVDLRKGIAYLIDMNGRVLHNWSTNKGELQHIEINNKGDLWGIVKDERLMKIDWNSNIIWENNLSFHHDIAIAENGDIYSITNDVLDIPYKGNMIPIINDYITILSPGGEVKKNASIFKLLGKKIRKERFEGILEFFEENPNGRNRSYVKPDSPIFDILHTNTIEIIEKNIGNIANEGDLLISVRGLNLIAIIDIMEEKVIWSWGEGYLGNPHHPTLLDNRNILIFDNWGGKNGSRVVELNPSTNMIEWTYESPGNFFSNGMGGNQRLPNGNTLITESDKGHVFEVTKEGRIVWEFWSPEINKEENKRGSIYRMVRLDPEVSRNLPFDQKTNEYLKENGYIS